MKLLQTLAEGGQTWAHRMRMVRQVMKIVLIFSLTCGLVFVSFKLLKLDPLIQWGSYYHVKGKIFQPFQQEVEVSSTFWAKVNSSYTSQAVQKVRCDHLSQVTAPYFSNFLAISRKICFQALYISMCSMICMLSFFLVRGMASKRKQHITGKRIASPLKLKLHLKIRLKASPFSLGSVPLLRNSETQHILVTGGTGSGKTNAFHHLLPQIKALGQKAIVVDTTGAFVSRYFDPSKDILLNPFDDRGATWHPWAECEGIFDYENIAESFIPQSLHDQENYWRTAARSVFSALLEKTSDLKQSSDLANWLLYSPLDQLADFLQGTKAAAHIDINSEKTAASIRSVASTFLKALEYIPDTKTPFSIKRWCTKEHEEGWLFLACKPSQRAALIPMLSCWISTAVRGLQQLEPRLSRRLWFIIDELPTLGKLKDLESLVTEGRKYGGCGLLAIQSPAQLEELYGRAAAQTIIGNCNTRLIFSEHDPEIAAKISRSIGESEIKEYQEGISYGAHEMRDGVTLSLHSKQMPVISVTDIQTLAKNRAYLKLSGNLPITKVKFRIN